MFNKNFLLIISLFLSFFTRLSISKINLNPRPRVPQINSNWLYWQGADGTGVSSQTGLPTDLNKSLIWTHDIQGGGVPVIAGGKAYQFGYYGTTDDLKEALVCFDASSGDVLWQKRHSDFISDIVYNRYGVGAACVDPASGNVYFQTSPGLLIGYDSDGNKLWERSLYGRVCEAYFS